MRTLLVVGLLAVGLSGCTGGLSVAADAAGQGQWASGTLYDNNFQCDGNAVFDAGAQGQGHIVISVRDATGATKASLTLNGQGQQGVDKDVQGTPGEWNLRVQVKDYNWGSSGGQYGGYDPYAGIDFQGQYGAVVRCEAP